MTREEANARLAEIQVQVAGLLTEATSLVKEHTLEFSIQLGEGVYRQNMKIGRYGVEAWESSHFENDYDDSWNSSYDASC